MKELLRRHKVELLIVAVVLAVVGPVVHEYRAQQASRYAMTAALWEEHTVVLNDYTQVLGIDRSVYAGHTYSDKAPGQPLLAVPFYAIYRTVGGQPGNVLQIDENLGLWWLTLWSAMIPGAALAALMYRSALRTAPKAAIRATLGMALGTILLPFSALLFGHVLAALLGFAGFLVVSKEPSRVRLVAGGALLGAAVTVEYTMVIVAFVLAAYLVWRAWKRVAWYVVGGAPFALGLAMYNWSVFGNPLVLSYQLSAFSEVTDSARRITDVFSSLQPVRLLQVFFAPRGFLVATPLVIVGLVGVVMMVRRRDLRAEGLVTAGVLLGFLLLPMMWGNPWGGDSPGPRYMLPALPFLALPAALAWRRLPLVSTVAAVVGVVTMGLATFTDPLLPREIGFGIVTWLGLAARGQWVPTLFTMWIGNWGWLFHAGLVIAAAVGLKLVTRPPTTDIVGVPNLSSVP
ncbi:MAG TPA: hypothetical protein ENH00_14040 [Actinobacteria bacterium]|nr:hypothetical protein BMS3Bbin01_00292 [bacterium BMS3Bbin01]HDH27292.1 hypothetical protein [Actinomycetota bacterium]